MMRRRLFPLLLVAALTEAIPAFQQHIQVEFTDITSTAGITYKHQNGATPEKYMPETMAGGALILDYDRDGWPDLFFVDGGSFSDEKIAGTARHRLYRNTGRGKFVDVTPSAGIGTSGYGMGACAADYDNDDWPDLYITAVGPDRLYHNSGDGTFTDVTGLAGIRSGLWSASCAFADIDNDGDVDLYVTRYVDFAVDNNKYCRLLEDVRGYCHPNVYNAIPDILYRNDGDGTFTDITAEAGINVAPAGNGLGVVFGDYDDDGWADIYVANDSTPNFLFHNKGNGTFEEVGLWAGVAVGTDGKPLAGMGADMADADGNGLLDIFVTNLDGQTHSLYRNLGKGLFSDMTFQSGIGEATLPFVGFGAAFLDYDNDGDLDLAVANGEVIDNISRLRDSTSYEQPNLLLRNDGSGTFESVGQTSGPGLALHKASRALSVADVDNDGDLDILTTNVGATPDLLRNDGGNQNNAILIRAIGSDSNRDGIGTRLKLFVGDRVLVREVKAGSSYLSESDLRIHFGLGRATHADKLEARWTSGRVEIIEDVPVNQILTLREGAGITDRQAFAK